LFQNKGESFTRLLALMMKPNFLVKDELVMKKGDVGEEMYFISHGTVEVINEDGSVVFARMKDGQFFGEVCLCKSIS
jgi:voltage-gated potassium channel